MLLLYPGPYFPAQPCLPLRSLPFRTAEPQTGCRESIPCTIVTDMLPIQSYNNQKTITLIFHSLKAYLCLPALSPSLFPLVRVTTSCKQPTVHTHSAAIQQCAVLHCAHQFRNSPVNSAHEGSIIVRLVQTIHTAQITAAAATAAVRATITHAAP